MLNNLLLLDIDTSILLILQISIFLSSIGVVIVRNPIYSILFLIMVFALTSVLFIILNSEFLAMILIIVYLGAVCVLFLFVVMMLNIKIIELKRQINFIPFFFVVFSLLVIVFSEKLWNFGLFIEYFFNTITPNNNRNFFFDSEIGSNLVWKIDIMKSIGLNLYTFYLLQFISASLVLLIAMVGAIFLTLEITSKGKKQFIFSQIARSRSLFLINDQK